MKNYVIVYAKSVGYDVDDNRAKKKILGRRKKEPRRLKVTSATSTTNFYLHAEFFSTLPTLNQHVQTSFFAMVSLLDFTYFRPKSEKFEKNLDSVRIIFHYDDQ